MKKEFDSTTGSDRREGNNGKNKRPRAKFDVLAFA